MSKFLQRNLMISIIQGFQIVFIFIVIFTTFRPMYSLSFFWYFLSKSRAYTKIRTTSFILSTVVASVNYNWVQVLSVSVLLGSWVRQETSEEGRRSSRPKRCEYNNKVEDNSLKTFYDTKNAIKLQRISSPSSHAAGTNFYDSLSRQSSQSSIALGRSSSLHPVSIQTCCRYVLLGRPTLACPCEGDLWRMSLMISFLLLQQCPAYLVHLTWMVLEIGGRWPYRYHDSTHIITYNLF